MTVEEYLRSLVPGLDLQDNVVARSARSPKEVDLDPLPLDEDIDYVIDPETGEKVPREDPDNIYQMRLDYASSTIGGYTITMADRARFKAMGDALRQKWGWETEADEVTTEICDISSLRRRY